MKLRFSSRAEREIASILDYLDQRSPRAAAGFSRRVGQVLDRLRKFPWSGHATSDSVIRVTNTAPYPYLVFYEISPSVIDVLAVIHGARNPSTMPAQRQ